MEDDHDTFFSSSFDPVRRALVLMLADVAVAEDATQEAFARAYRRWSRVSGMDDPTARVYVVAVNVARRAARRRRLLAWRDDEPRSAGDVAGAVVASVTVHALLADLTERSGPPSCCGTSRTSRTRGSPRRWAVPRRRRA